MTLYRWTDETDNGSDMIGSFKCLTQKENVVLSDESLRLDGRNEDAICKLSDLRALDSVGVSILYNNNLRQTPFRDVDSAFGVGKDKRSSKTLLWY